MPPPKKNRAGVWAGALGGIGLGILAIIQFGPAWLEQIQKWRTNEAKAVAVTPFKRLNYYIATITLKNIEGATAGQPNIRVYYNVTAEVETARTEDLFLIDRVKAGGGVEYIKTIPDFQVLNKTQWPADPTLLEFRVNPFKAGLTKFDLNGIGSMKIFLDNKKAKFGPHIPENTDFALMTIDFSRLKDFQLPSDFSAQVEGRDQAGSLQYGAGPAQLRNWYGVNKTVTVSARNLPADSSLLLIWGEAI